MPKHGSSRIGRGADPNVIKTVPEDRPPANDPVPEEPFAIEQNGDKTIVKDSVSGEVVATHTFVQTNGQQQADSPISKPREVAASEDGPPFQTTDGDNAEVPRPTISPQNRQVSQRPRTPPRLRGFASLICAPVGFGKSTLLSKFPGPIQLIIDENDRGILDQIALGRMGDLSKYIYPDETGTFGCPMIRNSKNGWITLNRYLGDMVKAITLASQKRGRALYWGEEVTFMMGEGDAAMKRTFTMPRTIGVESMSGIQVACFDHILKDDFGGDVQKFDSYGAGARKAGNREWPSFLRHMSALRDFGIDVVYTAHVDVTPDDTERINYKAQVPRLNKVTLGSLIKDCNMSVQMILDVDFEQVVEDKKTGVKTGKAEREAERKLIANPHPVYKHCKNHFGIPDMQLPDDGDKLYEAICKAAKFDPATWRPYGMVV